MTIIETITRQVPNTKEGREYLRRWQAKHVSDENVATDYYEDTHGITMMETIWLEGYGREINC